MSEAEGSVRVSSVLGESGALTAAGEGVLREVADSWKSPEEVRKVFHFVEGDVEGLLREAAEMIGVLADFANQAEQAQEVVSAALALHVRLLAAAERVQRAVGP